MKTAGRRAAALVLKRQIPGLPKLKKVEIFYHEQPAKGNDRISELKNGIP